MADDAALLRELHPTKMTLVRLLPRVNSHVLHLAVLSREAHAALLAREGFEPEVAAHVPRHGALLGEKPPADVAGERPGQPAAPLVLPQRGHGVTRRRYIWL